MKKLKVTYDNQEYCIDSMSKMGTFKCGLMQYDKHILKFVSIQDTVCINNDKVQEHIEEMKRIDEEIIRLTELRKSEHEKIYEYFKKTVDKTRSL